MKKLFLTLIVLISFISVNAQSSAPEVTEATTSGTLTVTATTVTFNGDHAPSNYLAIWIVNSAGTYVKTLMAYYGASHVGDLTNWVAANSTKDKTDAITGATLTSHGQRIATWNGTNKSGVAQTDGSYTVKLEMTENEGTGKLASVSFTKGTTSQTLTPSSVTGFSGITIKWIPTNTALSDLEFDNQYKLFPNPASASVYVSGFDIKEIELCTLNGKSVLITNNQKIDISGLPKGIYLVKLTTIKGTFFKKIEKI